MKWRGWVENGMLIVGVGLLVAGLGMMIRESKKEKPKVELIKSSDKNKAGGETKGVTEVYSKVIIDIAGEVVKPGVYQLKIGDRIGDALVVCGGLSKEADREWIDKNINRAEKVTDGMKIYIPKKGELMSNDKFQMSKENNQLININTADAKELDKLDGVGPSLAQKIIDYRVENGGFKNVEEIKLVPGIGEKMYANIKDKIKI